MRNILIRAAIFAALLPGLTLAGEKESASIGLMIYGADSAINDFKSNEDTDPVVHTYTHTHCTTHDYYQECDVWECEPSGSVHLGQNFSCALVDKYACDVGIDCDSDLSPRTRGSIDGFKSEGPRGADMQYTPMCHSVSECNDMISDCISVGGDFVPGTEDPNTSAPNAGYCRL